VTALPQLLISTVLLGGIYALIAVGLTLIFGIMRVVNFAHGEFLMLGMYLAFWSFTLWGVDPYFILVVAVPLFFAIGLGVYALVMRGVIHASHNVQIFTTVGLSTALQNVALVLWTGDFRFVRPWESSVVVRILGAGLQSLPGDRLRRRSPLHPRPLRLHEVDARRPGHARHRPGRRGRPPSWGINTDRVYRLAFAIGIACVGVAGVLVSPLYSVYPTAGLQFVLLAYVVVVLGGLGDMVGALLGALIVAGVEVIGSYVFGSAWKEVIYFVLFIAVLVFRPAGLFGQRGAEALGV
jgi:branched-chain amino acid transport system permease protein